MICGNLLIAWNDKTKVDEGCRASLVRIDVSGYPDTCVIAFGYRKWNAGRGDMATTSILFRYT